MQNQPETRCHRCGEVMTLYIVGDDYCRTCKREIRARQELDARRPAPRFALAKDVTPRDAA